MVQLGQLLSLRCQNVLSTFKSTKDLIWDNTNILQFAELTGKPPAIFPFMRLWHAAQGRNHYRIGAWYNEGSWIPDNYYADTVQQDRAFFLRFNNTVSFLASQELLPGRQTETLISVSYTPEAGVTGSQMVARSGKVGRFLGRCDAAIHICAVTGLSAGIMYDIWVRTCSGSGPTRCVLRAMPTQLVTYPNGMYCFNETALQRCNPALNK